MWILGILSVVSTIWTVSRGEVDEQCFQNCTCCIDAECGQGTHFPDECLKGCIDGHRGARCYELCQFRNCKSCGGNGTSNECDKCYEGYYLGAKKDCALQCRESCAQCSTYNNCSQCLEGKYGITCQDDCSVGCYGNTCSIDNGHCNCTKDFIGDTCMDCSDGKFGPFCNQTCSKYCKENKCNKTSGFCIDGCTNVNITGELCDKCITGQTYEQQDPAGLISWLVAIIVGVTWIFISIIFFRRRMRKHHLRSKNVDNSGTLSSDTGIECVESVKDAAACANTIDKTAQDADLVDETNDNELHYANDYCNFNTVNINVKVEDLLTYVTKDNFDIFEKEFENLPTPEDLSESCKIANKPENSDLNRYDSIYPFDHTRVTIPGQTKFYINACYIDGYNRSKAYIASSGPTMKHTARFKTFWQMVWHEKSDIIVMLTKLREASAMKCEQYWPEIEKEESYGHIKVKCQSIEEFAEYTVRSFTVTKGKEHRNLTQLHFTTWPDQGVPSEVTSVVEFRQRVKAVPVVLGGPVIVHCSAGIGRTGTYIALDILSEQGKAEHSVNVFNCVRKMRRQRVYMVQTVEQYIFLHKALVHTLLFGCESQTIEDIQRLAIDRNGTLMRMFQALKHEIDFEGEDELSAREENKTNHADKSRRHSDIPGHRGRVRLYLQRKSECHDYINAVFISSFKTNDFFIAAQTPQSGTLEDFLCMMYRQNTFCVVAFEDPIQLSKKHDVGLYLPEENGTYKCGEFTVTCLKAEHKPQYTLKKLTVKRTDKGEEINAYHFQYTKWRNGRKVADSPADFVQFVKVVEKYAKQRKANMTNVLVHCLNGYEKSGLFCVVYTLLEKLEAEGQVSVVNVIRKVRAQRKLSISSVEQLKFCYQCMSAFSRS